MPKVLLNAQDDLATKPSEKQLFVEWLATPKAEREPASMKKLEEVLGVTRQTLYNWRRDPRVVAKVSNLVGRNLSVASYVDVIESLKVQATDPENPRSVMAAKVLLIEIHKQSAEPELDLKTMSNKELQELAAGIYDMVDDRMPHTG